MAKAKKETALVKRVRVRHTYMAKVREIQDEVRARFIQNSDTIKDIVEHTGKHQAKPTSGTTIRRFLQYGRGAGRMYYGPRGPSSTTLLGCADAVGFEFILRYKKNQ